MASESLLEDVLRCRYPVDKSINHSGFGWDTPRLNEVIAAHAANLARPVDEADFYGVADAIAQALRDCDGEDPDTCSLSPKTLRRLRMALTVARDAREAAALAAKPDSTYPGWRPIESAPYERVLLFFPAEPDLLAAIRIGRATAEWWRKPSHWAPLPPPPGESSGVPAVQEDDRLDAKRYRWLRDNRGSVQEGDGHWPQLAQIDFLFESVEPMSLDAAIDAARAKGDA